MTHDEAVTPRLADGERPLTGAEIRAARIARIGPEAERIRRHGVRADKP